MIIRFFEFYDGVRISNQPNNAIYSYQGDTGYTGGNAYNSLNTQAREADNSSGRSHIAVHEFLEEDTWYHIVFTVDDDGNGGKGFTGAKGLPGV